MSGGPGFTYRIATLLVLNLRAFIRQSASVESSLGNIPAVRINCQIFKVRRLFPIFRRVI